MTTPAPASTPYGFCRCGCGEQTRLAPHDRADRGSIAGEPMPFLYRHSRRATFFFWDHVDKQADGCWIWTGRVSERGYGYIGEGKRRRRVHRWLWERERGPIPDGMELDHVCQNKLCINLDHLEVVTHAENMHRTRRSHCQRGHEMTEENTYRRRCRTCIRLGRQRRERLAST